MMSYVGESDFQHGEIPAVGILLTNLGTPDAPTTPALRRYLREFLSDPRVIELPAWKWQPILNLFVLTRRPPRSAAAYRAVWTPAGSPLLVTARKQADALRQTLVERYGTPTRVALGMRYGNPSVGAALDELMLAGCRRVLLLPLYPQYSAATTASTVDALGAALARRRWIPEVRTVNQYLDEPLYIRALANSIRETWEKGGEPSRLLLSFHGIPERYFRSGDPYHCQCHKTARRVAEELGLSPDRYLVTFQSRFGREPWLQPYTDETLAAWGRERLDSVDVVCPGFSADCLETLEEINVENRKIFLDAGGGRFRYIPALNDRPDHIAALSAVIDRHVQGWVETHATWNPVTAAAAANRSRERALQMGCPVGEERDRGKCPRNAR
ncbi:MAG: ferrochelatase [Planctomycetota bacterium]